jgi:hypothetical protein
VMPLSADRVDREEIGVFFDESRNLPLGKF